MRRWSRYAPPPSRRKKKRRATSPAQEGAREEFVSLLPREAGKGDRRAASAVVEGAQGGPPERTDG
jgi:hypothetical protein